MTGLWNTGLDGRVIVVTGAASGIGRATARQLAELGAVVVGVDRNAESLVETMAALENPQRHHGVEWDLSDAARVPALVEEIWSKQGTIDALVHPAAYLNRNDIADVTLDDWDLQLSVNLKATFFLNRDVAERMVSEGVRGRIVNFVSPVWQTGSSAQADVYAISKGGVLTLTRSMARRYGGSGILVNAISPGQINTPMQFGGNSKAAIDAGLAACPLGRMGEPEEVAAVAVFLVSDLASFVSGAVIPVSGGASFW